MPVLLLNWLQYADPRVAPLWRSRRGSITPIFRWLLYADHALAPIWRSVTPAVHALVSRLTERGVTAIPVSPNEGIDALLCGAEAFDAVIALPDSTVNRANIGHVVRTLYQERKVIIGYSDTLTRVGSLASVYPTTVSIARTVRDVPEDYAVRNVAPPPTFVREVDISVNERLARSLNIVLPRRADLITAVRSKPEAPP